eukprot:TRINITY_DN21900_c0_g2_i1.p1 TRINITY_DN21900_c0_g2~~TRINITY_DN21900_c0_g2_i1.p1  ORF type:complete len:634 (-),score=84.28 TRINITY_DN21900_c0_g2_i1:23-1861(-)
MSADADVWRATHWRAVDDEPTVSRVSAGEESRKAPPLASARGRGRGEEEVDRCSSDASTWMSYMRHMSEQLKCIKQSQLELQQHVTRVLNAFPNSAPHGREVPYGVAQDHVENASVVSGTPPRDVSPGFSRQVSPGTPLPRKKRRLKSAKSIFLSKGDVVESQPSRNSFRNSSETEQSDKDYLCGVFQVYEESMSRHYEKQSWRQLWPGYLRLCRGAGVAFDLWFDSIIGFMIVLNAMFIGLRMDHDENHAGFFFVDACFSIVFIAELCVHCWIYGVQNWFWGASKCANLFDASLILVDITQLLLELLATADVAMVNAPSASLFRVVRLTRLIRVVRLLKAPIFKDLVLMMHGMIGGMVTLGWSLVLFCIAVYVFALVGREFLGRDDTHSSYAFFRNVPQAMLTTFRCSFGDCNDSKGGPIFLAVQKEHGWIALMMYCLFVFFVSIGIFNIVSAIFLRAGVTAAQRHEADKRKERLRDHRLWSIMSSTIVARLLDISQGHNMSGSVMSQRVEDIYTLEVPNSLIDELVSDDIVRAALDALDLDPNDVEHLSEILDPDHGGTINVIELVRGVWCLRGEPRRSDIVSLNLMMRNVQLTLQEILTQLTAQPSRKG